MSEQRKGRGFRGVRAVRERQLPAARRVRPHHRGRRRRRVLLGEDGEVQDIVFFVRPGWLPKHR